MEKGIRQYEGLVRRIWNSRDFPHQPWENISKTIYKTDSLRKLVRTRNENLFGKSPRTLPPKAVAFKEVSTWRLYDTEDSFVDSNSPFYHAPNEFIPGVIISSNSKKDNSSSALQYYLIDNLDPFYFNTFNLRLEEDGKYCVHYYSLLTPSCYDHFSKDGLDKESFKKLRNFLENAVDFHLLLSSQKFDNMSNLISQVAKNCSLSMNNLVGNMRKQRMATKENKNL